MTRPKLIIGNKNYSSWSLRPWVLLRQNDIDFEEQRIALFTEEMDRVLGDYDSDSKVPVLQDGDTVVWDSLAICEYVSEKYLNGSGWPADENARAVARSISAEMHSSFPNLRNELPMNCRRQFRGIRFSAEADREIERVKSLWRRCREEYCKGGDWLFGEYSIADAMYAPVVLRFIGYSVPLEGVEKTYVERVLTQPCIQQWISAGKAEHEIIEMDEISV